jgi:HD-like signal output (HDOD) protein
MMSASPLPPQAQHLLRGLKDIPALPQVVTQVLEILNRPQATSSQVAHLVQFDPGLSSRLLRMVNSSAYGIPRQVTSVQHAIAMLGFRAVHGLVLGASICTLLNQDATLKNKDGLDVQAFWQHALLVSFLAKKIARLYRLPDEDEIFSAGMLHNIGVFVMCTQAPEQDAVLHKSLQKQGFSRFGTQALTVEEAIMGLRHTELGAALTQRWNLPHLMQYVIEHYPHPPEEPESPAASAVYSVSLAHYLLNSPEIQAQSPILQSGIPAPVLVFFSLDSMEDIQVLQEYVPGLREECQDIIQMFSPDV